ncbi:hypothetical protein SAMN04490190_2318 [Pseudomonas libanensis]|uniref:Uncharacterized protein n=1 Tax=Pseudomonas libanensis TaxID=75588 RepID=A0A0R2YFF2_9PSED|nr:hypothetical protein [Pseudomonas libanensis]KRP43902.1 hypothetical protein TU73_18095 [Pseudomonas libanensis]SDK91643.1 hypothetical protein SAMN04490190_2318 [Pseudomonas libanensis]
MYPKKAVTEQIKELHQRQGTHIGFFWYRDAEQYEHFLSIYEDRDTMHDTYALWHKSAMRAVKQYEKQGFITHRVYSTPEELAQWCRVNSMPLNGKSRSSFANEKLKAAAAKSPKSLRHSIGLAGH